MIELRQTHGRAPFIQAFGVLSSPATIVAVWARQGLGAIPLRPTFVHRNTVEQVSFLCERHLAPLHFVLNQCQRLTLKIRLSNGMLSDEPSGQGPIRTRRLSVRPAMLSNNFTQPLRVLPMNRFHPRRITLPELAGLQQFLADAKVFGSHTYQFSPQCFVHGHWRKTSRRNSPEPILPRSSFPSYSGLSRVSGAVPG